jgi:hypothetical protein
MDSLDGVDEKYHDLYEESDDGFILSGVETIVDKESKEKLGEFRDNNRKLFKEKQELEKKLKRFDGVDLDEIEDMKDRLSKLDGIGDKDLLKKGGIEAILKKRTKEIVADHEKQIKELQKARDGFETENKGLKKSLNELKVDHGAFDAAAEAGLQVKPEAREDFLGRARKAWKLGDDNEVVGNDLFTKGGDPMVLKKHGAEWVKGLLEKAEHLFEPGSGGGGGGGPKKKGKVKVIPNDPAEIAKNVEAIAKGEVVVDMG